MTLHTLNKAHPTHQAFNLCLDSLLPGDCLVLMEEAVYLVLESAFKEWLHTQKPAAWQCCAVAADLAARGISDKIPQDMSVIDYTDFVGLCLQHDRVVNWN